MLTRKYISLVLLCAFISSTGIAVTDDRYTRNIRQDRCVWISILIGAVLTAAFVPPGAYYLAPHGAFNMQPNCPQGSPIQCCDPKTAGQNVTTAPNNCTPLPTGVVACDPPKEGFCFGATVPADLVLQEWAKRTGGALLAVGLVGALYSVGAAVRGCCLGTCLCAL